MDDGRTEDTGGRAAAPGAETETRTGAGWGETDSRTAQDLRAHLGGARGGRAVERVVTPGLGPLYVREMTGGERDAYDAAMLRAARATDATEDEIDNGTAFILVDGWRAMLLVRVLCDARGALVYQRPDAAAVEEVAALPRADQDALYEAADRLNGLGGSGHDDAVGN